MEQIIMYIITTLIGLFIGFIVKNLSAYGKRHTTQDKALRNLLKAELVSQYYQFKKIGSIPIHAKQTWNSMFESYTELGGNSFVKEDIKPKMDMLPTCEEVG